MNESNKNNNKQETAPREVPRDLPELEEVDVATALSHQNLSWAHGFMDAYSVGETLWLDCLLYTSPSPRDRTRSRMPSSA